MFNTTSEGTVSSVDGKIDCGDTCSAAYEGAEVVITLTATPYAIIN